MSYLLDTNIVSASLKQNVTINAKLQEVSKLELDIFISGITYYEVQRGLLRSNATKKLALFAQFCQDYPVLFLDDLRIFQKASE
ncbi:MAG: VapC toxin family PIN domain ribonuclease, partial [Sphaerospermopsis kisseleviana]